MNFTYILGNGLDLQFGLKTGYIDFYDNQKSIFDSEEDSSWKNNFIYEELMNDSKNKYKNWSDLELAIGELTKSNIKITESTANREKFLDDLVQVTNDIKQLDETIKATESKLLAMINNFNVNDENKLFVDAINDLLGGAHE